MLNKKDLKYLKKEFEKTRKAFEKEFGFDMVTGQWSGATEMEIKKKMTGDYAKKMGVNSSDLECSSFSEILKVYEKRFDICLSYLYYPDFIEMNEICENAYKEMSNEEFQKAKERGIEMNEINKKRSLIMLGKKSYDEIEELSAETTIRGGMRLYSIRNIKNKYKQKYA